MLYLEFVVIAGYHIYTVLLRIQFRVTARHVLIHVSVNASNYLFRFIELMVAMVALMNYVNYELKWI